MRQRKEERGSLIRFGLEPDAAAVLAHDALDNGQPYACSFKLFRVVNPFKEFEQSRGFRHIEPNAIVSNVKGREVIDGCLANFDFGDSPRPGVFQGIVEKTEKKDVDETGIASDWGEPLHFPLHIPPEGIGLELGDCVPNERL